MAILPGFNAALPVAVAALLSNLGATDAEMDLVIAKLYYESPPLAPSAVMEQMRAVLAQVRAEAI